MMISDWMYNERDIGDARAEMLREQIMMLQAIDERGKPEWERDDDGVMIPVITWSNLPATLAALGAPARLAQWSKHGIDESGEAKQMEAIARLAELIDAIAVGERPQKAGALLVGNTSTGKTTIAVAALRVAIRRSLTVKFFNYEAFIEFHQKRLEMSKNADRFDDFADRMDEWHRHQWLARKIYDIVVIDDIGRVADVPNIFKQEVHSLLRARFDAGKFTIITTNLSPEAWRSWDERMADFVQREFMVVGFGVNHKVVDDGRQ